MTDLERMELAIRRVSSCLKQQVPWDMAVTEALDALADELAVSPDPPVLVPDGYDRRPGAVNRVD